jgi:hypothetical protein
VDSCTQEPLPTYGTRSWQSRLENLGRCSTSKPLGLDSDITKEERVLGGNAVGDVDNGGGHVPNVVSGLKA